MHSNHRKSLCFSHFQLLVLILSDLYATTYYVWILASLHEQVFELNYYLGSAAVDLMIHYGDPQSSAANCVLVFVVVGPPVQVPGDLQCESMAHPSHAGAGMVVQEQFGVGVERGGGRQEAG